MSNHNKQQHEHKGRWGKYLGNAWSNKVMMQGWKTTNHNEQQYQGKGNTPQQATTITNANAMGFIHDL